jgi:hypothetical protein
LRGTSGELGIGCKADARRKQGRAKKVRNIKRQYDAS